MPTKAHISAEAARLLAEFSGRGAVPVETDILQPADRLLDLYGEDIRARAYVTSDPLRGERMLRPDFTVPVTLAHLESGANAGRYCYAGEVFRRQEDDENRASEYIQVGYEVFGDDDAAAAEAEVFAAIAAALGGLPVRAAMGDIGFLVAAIDGLETPDRRKTALRRHLWRPARFRALVERYARKSQPPADASSDAPHIGLRSGDEIAARLAVLADEAGTVPLSTAEVARLDAILVVRATAPEAAGALRKIAAGDPALIAAVDRLEARLAALRDLGIDPINLDFEASYGLTNMEYYDGFVFGFTAAGGGDLPAVATGGRYDALTRRLGHGQAVPAVGAVIRPDVVVALRGDRS